MTEKLSEDSRLIRNNIPGLNAYDLEAAELLELYYLEHEKKRFVQKSTITGTIDEVRELARMLEAENRKLRVENKLLRYLVWVFHSKADSLLRYLGLSWHQIDNPYTDKPVLNPTDKISKTRAWRKEWGNKWKKRTKTGDILLGSEDTLT